MPRHGATFTLPPAIWHRHKYFIGKLLGLTWPQDSDGKTARRAQTSSEMLLCSDILLSSTHIPPLYFLRILIHFFSPSAFFPGCCSEYKSPTRTMFSNGESQTDVVLWLSISEFQELFSIRVLMFKTPSRNLKENNCVNRIHIQTPLT